MSHKLNIRFALSQIETLEFATIEEHFDGTSKTIELSIEPAFEIDVEQHFIATVLKVQFKQTQLPFLIIKTRCVFNIEEKSWTSLLDQSEDSLIRFPKGFITHLLMLSVGTIRGILHEKTNGTDYNDFILPTINVTELVDEDVIFDR